MHYKDKAFEKYRIHICQYEELTHLQAKLSYLSVNNSSGRINKFELRKIDSLWQRNQDTLCKKGTKIQSFCHNFMKKHSKLSEEQILENYRKLTILRNKFSACVSELTKLQVHSDDVTYPMLQNSLCQRYRDKARARVDLDNFVKEFVLEGKHYVKSKRK